MKKLLIAIFRTVFFTLISWIACESEPVTGDEDVAEIDHVSITVDTTYAFGNSFVAEGIVENLGPKTISPIWYLEASFFSNKRESFKLGGDNTSYSFSLEDGQSTGWELTLKSSRYNAPDYPNFDIRDLKVYKDEVRNTQN